MSDTRESLKARIRALAARTVENGCTEAEAMTAADLLGRLMTKYAFTQEDLEEREPITEDTYIAPGKTLGSVAYVAQAIAEFCDCKAWMTRVGYAASRYNGVKFFGHESDAEVAKYLTHLCHAATESAWKEYVRANPVTTYANGSLMNNRRVRTSFELAMAVRLRERFREMKAEREKMTDGKRTGRDLVVTKNALVDRAARERGMRFRETKRTQSIHDVRAFSAGRAAADRVNLTTGITGGRSAPRLTYG